MAKNIEVSLYELLVLFFQLTNSSYQVIRLLLTCVWLVKKGKIIQNNVRSFLQEL